MLTGEYNSVLQLSVCFIVCHGQTDIHYTISLSMQGLCRLNCVSRFLIVHIAKHQAHLESRDSFIHSFWPFLSRPFKSSTAQRRSRLQHGYCIGVSRRSTQATAGKGLAQGPYMAAKAGVEPATLRLRVITSTNAPPCPNNTSYR